ncbi:MAG TPA: hypothetical protein VN700_01890 [Vicinamibacterales bacterium]|nr:hypothetical protein [Vicinamibacterales bacterium]
MSSVFWVSYVSLWLLMAVVMLAVFVLLRHHAQVVLSSRAARNEYAKPKDGMWPRIELPDITGRSRFVADDPGVHLVMIFVRDCALCNKAIPALEAFGRDMEAHVRLWCVYGASESVTRRWAEGMGAALSGISVLSDSRVALQRSLRVTQTPYGIVVKDGRIVKAGLASNRRNLEWLMEGSIPEAGVETKSVEVVSATGGVS